MYIVLDTRVATITSTEDEALYAQIRIYPNPSDQVLQIVTPPGRLLFDQIEIRDSSGRVVKQFAAGLSQYPLDLPAGTYQVSLKMASRVVKTEPLILLR